MDFEGADGLEFGEGNVQIDPSVLKGKRKQQTDW